VKVLDGREIGEMTEEAESRPTGHKSGLGKNQWEGYKGNLPWKGPTAKEPQTIAGKTRPGWGSSLGNGARSSITGGGGPPSLVTEGGECSSNCRDHDACVRKDKQSEAEGEKNPVSQVFISEREKKVVKGKKREWDAFTTTRKRNSWGRVA